MLLSKIVAVVVGVVVVMVVVAVVVMIVGDGGSGHVVTVAAVAVAAAHRRRDMWLVGRVFVTGLLVVGGPGVWAARERDATTSHESSSEEARDAWHDQEATESLKSFFSINPPRQQGGRSQWAPSPWGRPAEPRPNLPWHTAPRTPPPTTRRPPKYSLRLSPFQGTYPFESEVRGESYHSRIRFHHLGSKAKLNHPPRGQTFGNWGFPKFSHDGRDSHSHEHRSQHTGTFSDNSQETGTSFHGPHEIGESLGTTGPSPSHSSSHYQQPVKEGTLETLPYPDDYPDTFPETGAPQPTHTHSDSHKNVQTTQQLPDPLHQLHDSSGREPSLEVNERTPPQDSQAPRPFLHPGNLEALLEGSQLKEAKGEGSTSLDYLNEDEAIDSEPPEEDQPDASHHLLDSSHHGPDAPVPTAARENAGPEDEVGFSSPVLPNDDFHDYVDPSVGHTSPRASSEGTGQPNRPQASEDLTPTTPRRLQP
ncbi:hypothetical protein O3P69_001569 [Scylla paramamosain]|uniref:Uncharacterized protein n=1 Tax=Scylla paramamosain TaxID=85552 RepID=A0AAW0V0R4_SCYPA